MIKGGVTALMQKYESAKNSLARQRENADNMGRIFVGTAVSGVTGAALGYYDGAHGGKEIFDAIPLAGAVGMAGIAAEFFEVGGKETSRYLGDAGRAGVAVWGYNVGRSTGIEAKQKKDSTSTSGDDSILDGLV